MKIQEIQVSAPWGHIAAKLWGDEYNAAILCFHGLLDNAGSFDLLIPHLPSSFFYICIDLPGHGFSSHFPQGLPIHTTNNLIAYEIVVQFFKRKNYVFLGHSYGGQIGLMFAQMHPEYVLKIINLDSIYLYPSYPNYFLNQLLESHKQILNIWMNQSKTKRPVYSYKEALTKIIASRSFGKLDKNIAEPLLKRMIMEINKDQYIFTNDNRLKKYLDPSASFNYYSDLFTKRPVTCPVFLILAEESRIQRSYFEPLLKTFRKLGFQIFIIGGSHVLHLKSPEKVAPIINNILLGMKNKL